MKNELEQYREFIKSAQVLTRKDPESFLFREVSRDVVLTLNKPASLKQSK